MALTIKEGNLLLYYCFDVAYSIRLDQVEKVFGKKPETSKLVYERLTPKHVQYKTPPLLVRLGRQEIKTRGYTYRANTKAKLYDFGVITIVYEIPIRGEISNLTELTRRFAENEKVAKMAKEHVEKLVKELQDVLEKPQEKFDFWEDYQIISVRRFDKRITTEFLLEEEGKNIAKALRCETARLSNFELENALKYVLSYYENDLVAIDWRAAFTYDPRQSYDVIDVLEYAVIQLLELRAYDKILDVALEKAYADVNSALRLSVAPYGKILHGLTEVKLDVTEVLDRLNDFLKLVGDLYLAKVYRAAAQRFYLDNLQSALNEKLSNVESIYKLLSERANNRMMMILEITIVALFILDIILLFWPLK